MRYKIENSKVVASFIDAPYDTKADAIEALEQGVKHNCEKCTDVPCIVEYDQIVWFREIRMFPR